MLTSARLSLLLSLLFLVTACTQTVDAQESISRRLITQTGEINWGLAVLNEREFLVTTRPGRLLRVDRESGAQQAIQGIPEVWHRGQGGLLDVVVRQNQGEPTRVYLTYSKPFDDGTAATAMGRGILQGNQLSDWEELIETRSRSSSGQHFGSRLAFDNTGYVYLTIGDRGERENGQNLLTHAGTVLRLHDDGRVPKDNPYVNRSDALPEIWSWGHRNPQGLDYDAVTGTLWLIEHGPRGGDEINIVRKGANYGWPVISYGKEYWAPLAVGEGTEKEGMEQPVKEFSPSIAPGSLLVYQGSAFRGWKGSLLSGALKLTHLNRVSVDSAGRFQSEERLLDDWGQRIRPIAELPDGHLLIGTDAGEIYELMPSAE